MQTQGLHLPAQAGDSAERQPDDRPAFVIITFDELVLGAPLVGLAFGLAIGFMAGRLTRAKLPAGTDHNIGTKMGVESLSGPRPGL
jgi:hypothetical protein